MNVTRVGEAERDDRHSPVKAEEAKSSREDGMEMDPPGWVGMGSRRRYLRGLRAGGVLLELTVMDGEVGPEVAAVAERGYTATTQTRTWSLLSPHSHWATFKAVRLLCRSNYTT